MCRFFLSRRGALQLEWASAYSYLLLVLVVVLNMSGTLGVNVVSAKITLR